MWLAPDIDRSSHHLYTISYRPIHNCWIGQVHCFKCWVYADEARSAKFVIALSHVWKAVRRTFRHYVVVARSSNCRRATWRLHQKRMSNRHHLTTNRRQYTPDGQARARSLTQVSANSAVKDGQTSQFRRLAVPVTPASCTTVSDLKPPPGGRIQRVAATNFWEMSNFVLVVRRRCLNFPAPDQTHSLGRFCRACTERSVIIIIHAQNCSTSQPFI